MWTCGSSKYATVSELLTGSDGSWNSDLIDTIFWEVEAAAIKSIPLVSINVDDKLVWTGCPDDKFSAKSGYHMEMGWRQSLVSAGGSGSIGLGWKGEWWKSLWKLNIPNKIKIFAWRSCRDILPTRNKLKQRKIIQTANCPLCQSYEESTVHILWQCKALRGIWRGVFGEKWLDYKDYFKRCSDSMHMMALFLDCKLASCMELIWTIAWFIWKRRNGIVFHEIPFEASSIWDIAAAWLEEWQEVQRCRLAKFRCPPHHPASGMSSWSPPPVNVFKINFDGAVFESQCSAGVGAVIRNSAGEVMATMVNKVAGVVNSEYIEALAAIQALDVAIDIGYQEVILEGDALRVIQAINSNAVNLSSIGHLIEEIRAKADRKSVV